MGIRTPVTAVKGRAFHVYPQMVTKASVLFLCCREGQLMPHHSYKGCPHISDAEYFERVKSRVKIDENGCWLWQGFVNPGHGYADMSYRGKSIRVHRLMYKLSGRELRAGLDVCHSCDQPTCCNPDHLWQGTAKDNMRDASLKGRIYLQRKTHCIRGHEFTPENTRVYSNQHGHIMRRCIECSRSRWQREKRTRILNADEYSAPNTQGGQ